VIKDKQRAGVSLNREGPFNLTMSGSEHQLVKGLAVISILTPTHINLKVPLRRHMCLYS
jgi:hypothetical protein